MRPTTATGSRRLELFFDLVFVYALTQVTALMAHRPTWTGALEGLIVLALLWFAWSAYAWLGNQAKADEGVLRLGLVVAMTSIFVVALAIPRAFDDPPGGIPPPRCCVAAASWSTRAVHLTVYLLAAGDDAGLRHQLLVTSVPIAGWAVLHGGRRGGPRRAAAAAVVPRPRPSTTSASSSRRAPAAGG